MNKFDLALLTGVDIPIPECRLIIHQPRIKDISMIGEREYLQGIQMICVDKTLDDSIPEEMSNFQVFMTILTRGEMVDQKNLIMDIFKMLFPKYTISITPRSLLFNLKDENIIIDEDNFEQLQAIIRQICCLSGKNGDSFNPANEAAAEIAKKLMRGRQKVATQKAAENDGSILGQYMSIAVVALHQQWTEIIEWTMYQLYDIIERYSLYTAWDIDVRSRLAGGKPDSEPDNWMKIIH